MPVRNGISCICHPGHRHAVPLTFRVKEQQILQESRLPLQQPKVKLLFPFVTLSKIHHSLQNSKAVPYKSLLNIGEASSKHRNKGTTNQQLQA